MELDDEKGYPWRASLTKVARCGMCKNCIGLGDGCQQDHKIVYPLINGEHHCPDYAYLPDKVPEKPTYVFAIPEFSFCKDCSNFFMGACSGKEWIPAAKKYKDEIRCEFYRDKNLICKNAIPTLQYGNHIRNNYCKCPPRFRDEDAKAGWKWMCPNAHNQYVEGKKCYRPAGDKYQNQKQ